MTDKKGWGSAVLGWFVVQDGQAAGQPDDATGEGNAIYDQAEPFAATDVQTGATTDDNTPAPFAPGALPAAPGGQVDFAAVFDGAGVDEEERERVAKAAALVNSLPAGTDMAVKKQIVEASLKAFGVPIEKIIEAGAAEIQALEFYIRAGAADTEKLINESDQRIKDYEAEINNLRLIMQERVAEQQQVVRACNDKKLEVQQILEFFGRDAVAAVVKASPKLHDPSAPPPAATTDTNRAGDPAS